jgi:tetratricopeptide (TPR) repeat protein
MGEAQTKDNSQILLKELSETSCSCIDKIDTKNKDPKTVALEVNKCIKEQIGAYQLGAKLMKIDTTNLKSNINIAINENEESDEFKKYYFEMERYLFENCKSLEEKIASYEKQTNKSISDNPRALGFYDKGIGKLKTQDFKKAIFFFKKAVKIDPNFAFAWDNLGISYRKINEYDKAIASYEKSLEIDPNGKMPLQNIAIVYQYKKEYQKAIDTYKSLAKLDDNNPEVVYGIGQIYAIYLKDYEKGLDYMCKAYIMYSNLKSPYRTDAENIINIIYKEMEKQDKVEKFNEILKNNNISQ